jgi:hypothetical protein
MITLIIQYFNFLNKFVKMILNIMRKKFCFLRIVCSSLSPFLNLTLSITSIGLQHPLDGVTNPKYMLLHFLTTKFLGKEKKAQAFDRDW